MKTFIAIFTVTCCTIGTSYAKMQFTENFNLEWSVVSGRMLQPKCVNIPLNMTLCHGIGYEQMRLPNLLEHDDLKESVEQAENWNPLIGIRCHPDTQVFLCSLFSPICLERVVYPCKSLCESVRDDCEGYMQQYGFTWPEMLECNKFPDDNDLCIHGPSASSRPVDDWVCKPCKEPDTYEGIIHNYCKADYVIRATVKGIDRTSDTAEAGEVELKMGKRKKKFYKRSDTLPKRIYKQLANQEAKIYISDGIGCKCDKRVEPKDHHLMGIRVVEAYDVTGQKITRFYADFITSWSQDRKAKVNIKKALRAIRKNDNICEGGVSTLNTHREVDGQVRGKKSRRTSRKKQRL